MYFFSEEAGGRLQITNAIDWISTKDSVIYVVHITRKMLKIIAM
jgi:hypothetical protein